MPAPAAIPAPDARSKPAKAQPGPILAVVSLARQRVWVYGSAGLIAQSAVSTGMAGHRTPAGVFSVVQKNRFHKSNIYSAAPMPFMQRITWSGIALHAGVVPGYPASHGCIRLPHQFAVELWGMTKVGARVIVVPDDPSVFHIEHTRLPVPLLTAELPVEGGRPAKAKAEGATAALETASIDAKSASLSDAEGETAAPAVKLTHPIERAKAARVRAVADAAAKGKAAKAAFETSATKAAAASRTIAILRKAEQALATAVARRDAAAAAIDEAAPPERIERAKARLAAAETVVADLEKAAEAARAAEAAATPEALAAAKAAWEAEKASTEAASALKSTERNTEPISIFVSKKAGRVYVRQAWASIHDAPVAFEQPEMAVGTHLYVATVAEDGGRALRWLSVSIPPSQATLDARGDARAVPASTASAGRPSLDAVAALARFQLPEETRRFIEDRLWTGASLIVSDEGISSETGPTTDFIVLTR